VRALCACPLSPEYVTVKVFPPLASVPAGMVTSMRSCYEKRESLPAFAKEPGRHPSGRPQSSRRYLGAECWFRDFLI
jgi:hypothetical protein